MHVARAVKIIHADCLFDLCHYPANIYLFIASNRTRENGVKYVQSKL